MSQSVDNGDDRHRMKSYDNDVLLGLMTIHRTYKSTRPLVVNSMPQTPVITIYYLTRLRGDDYYPRLITGRVD